MPIVPFVTQTYQHKTPNVSASQTLNLYPELVGADSKGAARVEAILVGTPGTEVFSDVESIAPNTNCRGLHYTADSRLFGVYGPNLIETDSNGVPTIKNSALGSLSTIVSMADNGSELIIADGQNLYVYDLKNETSNTPTLPFTNPSKVGYFNQRFFAINEGTETGYPDKNTKNRFYWSDPNDGEAWDALSFASAESSADPIIAFEVRQDDIWFFGPRSYEAWRTSPNLNLPVQRVSGSATEVGCGAKNSASTIAENIFWLGSSSAGTNQIFMTNAYSHRRISNHAIENTLNSSGDRTDDAVGFSYQENGHVFYVISFITLNKTFVYDITSDMWHERGTRDRLLNIVNRWEPVFSAFAFSRVVVGDSKNAKILRLNLNKYEEWDGRPIVRQHQSPIYWDDLKVLIHRRFELDIETGVGLQSGQGSDPQIMLQYSDDGGHTWSSERWTSIGKVGEYKSRASWRSLGRARERVYRVRISDPVNVTIMGGRVIAEITGNP
jgi:hypothetical protein